jgi:peptidoglycan/xylan/chitin deacetylase (PgdA/CDA1 family)
MSEAASWIVQAGKVARGARPPFALCYHGVGEVEEAEDPHGLFVSRELFEHHLDLIEARGYRLVSLSELWRLIERGEGEGHGAITFDDGLRRTVDTAIPILHQRGIASTMYLPSGLLGTRHPDLKGDERIIERAQVAEMVGQGVEVGAHTVDHVKLTELGQDEALEQMRRSKAELEDLLGGPVTSMAYPFGALDDGVVAAARAAGYQTACACSGPGPWLALSVPREPVFSSANDLRMSLKLAGLYGPVHRIAAARRRLRERG